MCFSFLFSTQNQVPQIIIRIGRVIESNERSEDSNIGLAVFFCFFLNEKSLK